MSSAITETARELRKEQTPAEKIFWEMVRGRKFLNIKFSRQFPVPVFVDGKRRFYIADFYSFELQLIVEVDGSVHDAQKEYDLQRTQILSRLGLRVIRFSNEEVSSDIDGVLKKLEQEIKNSPLWKRGARGEL